MTARRSLAAAALLLLAGVALRLVALGQPDLVGGDEGYYGTYARNLLAGGFDQLLNLGRDPLSAPDNKPFLFPLLLAGPVAALGPTELAVRLVPALAGFACAWLVGLLVARRYGRFAAWAAAFATLLLPPLVYASRVVMGEGLLAAFGLAGAWAAVRALEERRSGPALLAGFFWGCGFLVKLWLVGLFILPVGVALLADRGRRREAAAWGRMALAGGAFVVVGGSHLILVAVWSPATLQHWFEQYFIFSLFGRAGGQEFAGYWHQSWSFYLRSTLQSTFMVLPLVAAALTSRDLPASGRESALPQRPLWVTLAAELLVISFMGVKLRQYSFPLLPAVAALAGIGAAGLLTGRERLRPGFAALLALIPCAGVLLWQRGATPLFPTAPLAAAAALFLAGSAFALGLARIRNGVLALALVAAVAFAAVAGSALTVQRECLSHRTGYREAARAAAPLLAGRQPRDTVFLAPEVPALQYYLFRTGRYWTTPYEPRDTAQLLAMVADPRVVVFVTTTRGDLYGGPTPQPVIDWLAAHTLERTAEIVAAAGRPLPIRLFVRASQGETR